MLGFCNWILGLVLYFMYFFITSVLLPHLACLGPPNGDVILYVYYGRIWNPYTILLHSRTKKCCRASFLAPFEYSRLVFAIPNWGIFFREKWPSLTECIELCNHPIHSMWCMLHEKKNLAS